MVGSFCISDNITAHRSAAFELVQPRLGQFSIDYPEIVVELVIDDGLVDIVAAGFDAGIRRAPSPEKDMVSVRLDDGDALDIVASPAYITGCHRTISTMPAGSINRLRVAPLSMR